MHNRDFSEPIEDSVRARPTRVDRFCLGDDEDDIVRARFLRDAVTGWCLEHCLLEDGLPYETSISTRFIHSQPGKEMARTFM